MMAIVSPSEVFISLGEELSYYAVLKQGAPSPHCFVSVSSREQHANPIGHATRAHI